MTVSKKPNEAAKKAPSKATLNAKKSTTDAAALKKTRSTVSVDKTKSSVSVDKAKSMMSVDKTVDEKEKPAKKKEKWPGEEAANTFTRNMLAVNIQNEYDEIQKMPSQLERCKIWQANSSRNRHPDYKCYDDSRLIVQLCKSDYINGTKINVPNVRDL